MPSRTILGIGMAVSFGGCGPSVLMRGNGSWRHGASLVLYPLTFMDESLDPPLDDDDRGQFQSAQQIVRARNRRASAPPTQAPPSPLQRLCQLKTRARPAASAPRETR